MSTQVAQVAQLAPGLPSPSTSMRGGAKKQVEDVYGPITLAEHKANNRKKSNTRGKKKPVKGGCQGCGCACEKSECGPKCPNCTCNRAAKGGGKKKSRSRTRSKARSRTRR